MHLEIQETMTMFNEIVDCINDSLDFRNARIKWIITGHALLQENIFETKSAYKILLENKCNTVNAVWILYIIIIGKSRSILKWSDKEQNISKNTCVILLLHSYPNTATSLPTCNYAIGYLTYKRRYIWVVRREVELRAEIKCLLLKCKWIIRKCHKYRKMCTRQWCS